MYRQQFQNLNSEIIFPTEHGGYNRTLLAMSAVKTLKKEHKIHIANVIPISFYPTFYETVLIIPFSTVIVFS